MASDIPPTPPSASPEGEAPSVLPTRDTYFNSVLNQQQVGGVRFNANTQVVGVVAGGDVANSGILNIYNIQLVPQPDGTWGQGLAEPRSIPPCPYPGLLPFRPEDAPFFYGRQREIAELLLRLQNERLLLLIGPSGSGKSSLIFAGLLPALAEQSNKWLGYWYVVTMRPGSAPASRLSDLLAGDLADPEPLIAARLAEQPAAERLLLIVDQLEETFTPRGNAEQAAEQARFLAALRAILACPAAALILTLRADFYPDLMTSVLWDLAAPHQFAVTPLRGMALREAIQHPAAQMGIPMDGALVDRLLVDAAEEPGSLPLLQQTLLLLWSQMKVPLLTLADYTALGRDDPPAHSGLAVALALYADSVFWSLASDEQQVARRIFLRLVQFGEGRPDIRRQQTRRNLSTTAPDSTLFAKVLSDLASKRLLTVSRTEDSGISVVDIAHEALITNWPRLQNWIKQARESEQTRRRLEAKAEEWVRLGRGAGGLLDAVELREADEWLHSPGTDELSYSEELLALVTASRTALEEIAQAIEAARQRELAQVQDLAEERQRVILVERQRADEQVRTSRRLRQRAVALGVLLLLAILGVLIAGWQADIAQQAQQAAEKERQVAQAHALAAQAESGHTTYPQRSALLAIEALTTARSVDSETLKVAEEALRETLSLPEGTSLSQYQGLVSDATISPDSRWLLTGGRDGTLGLWDLAAPDPVSTFRVVYRGASSINTLDMSADGHWIVTGSGDGTLQLLDWQTSAAMLPARVLRRDMGYVWTTSLSGDGHWLITYAQHDGVRLWNLQAPDPVVASRQLFILSSEGHATLSGNGYLLATGGPKDPLSLSDLRATNPFSNSLRLGLEEAGFYPDNVSADGQWVVADNLHETRLWNLNAPARSYVLDPKKIDSRVMVISADSHWLITGDVQGGVVLWDLRAADPTTTFRVLAGHTGKITAATMSVDTRWLVTASEDRTVRLWDLSTGDAGNSARVLYGHESDVTSIGVSRDNHWLVTIGEDGARLWNLQAPDFDPATHAVGHSDSGLSSVEVSSKGHWLLTQGQEGTIELRSLQRGSAHATVPILKEGPVQKATISSDGRWLVAGSPDGTVCLWDLWTLKSSSRPQILGTMKSAVDDVVITQDNHWLVSRSRGETRLWDLTKLGPSPQSRALDRADPEWTPDSAMVTSADSRWLILGKQDGRVMLWDLSEPDLSTPRYILRAARTAIKKLVLSQDARWLVTGSEDGGAWLWDLQAADPAASSATIYLLPDAHSADDWTAAISADSHWLVTQSRQFYVSLVNLQSPDLTNRVLSLNSTGVLETLISSDSQWLIGGSNAGAIWFWNLAVPDDPPLVRTLRGHDQRIERLVLSADSRWLITTDIAGMTRLWDLQAPDPTATSRIIHGSNSPVAAVTIGADSDWVTIGGADGTITLWSLQVDDLITRACQVAGRNLTHAEWQQYMGTTPYHATCPDWAGPATPTPPTGVLSVSP